MKSDHTEQLENSNEILKPEVHITVSSVEDEVERVTHYAKNYSRGIVYPQTLSGKKVTNPEINDAVRSEYDASFYVKGITSLEQHADEISYIYATLLTYREAWGFELEPDVNIRVTRYGTAGSYYLHSNEVIVRADRDGNFGHENPTRDVAHELIHFAVEHLVKQYEIPQREKERIVDILSATMYPDLFPDLAEQIGTEQLSNYRTMLAKLPEVFAQNAPKINTEVINVNFPEDFVYKKILEIYPFLSEAERQAFIRGASEIEKSATITTIEGYLKLLDNPHATIRELQPKDTREYPSPIERPKGLDKWLPYGVMVGDILYVDIPSWTNHEPEITPTLNQLMLDYGDKAKGFVLDLRKNTGGSDTPARKFAQHFLPTGDIGFGKHVIKGIGGNLVEEPSVFHSANETPNEMPIVILVSDSSFSSCERFIALMRQRKGVTLIGSETGGGSAGAEIFHIQAEGRKYTIPIPKWRFYLPGEDKPLEETKIKPDIYEDPKSPEIVTKAFEYLTKQN